MRVFSGLIIFSYNLFRSHFRAYIVQYSYLAAQKLKIYNLKERALCDGVCLFRDRQNQMAGARAKLMEDKSDFAVVRH
jgi:hypothetical protein